MFLYRSRQYIMYEHIDRTSLCPRMCLYMSTNDDKLKAFTSLKSEKVVDKFIIEFGLLDFRTFRKTPVQIAQQSLAQAV